MSDWTFAQRDASEQLARMHYFSMKHNAGDRDVEFTIKVYEYVTPPDPAMPFFAEADKQTNQKTMPYTPTGWGRTLLEALSRCRDAVVRFPYQGD
ncbi:MAG: hypothetical protein HYZ37_17245 [Candidatus Solibacter usitatus]|nr:hypothetical protein [Candidatus Solibacter usitatus]